MATMVVRSHWIENSTVECIKGALSFKIQEVSGCLDRRYPLGASSQVRVGGLHHGPFSPDVVHFLIKCRRNLTPFYFLPFDVLYYLSISREVSSFVKVNEETMRGKRNLSGE